MHAAKFELDNLGTVNNHAFVVNNPKRRDITIERYKVEASVAKMLDHKDQIKEADHASLGIRYK